RRHAATSHRDADSSRIPGLRLGHVSPNLVRSGRAVVYAQSETGFDEGAIGNPVMCGPDHRTHDQKLAGALLGWMGRRATALYAAARQRADRDRGFSPKLAALAWTKTARHCQWPLPGRI